MKRTTADRDRKLAQLLEGALDLDPELRDGYLERLCDDQDMVREAQLMLSADTDSPDPLAAPHAAIATAVERLATQFAVPESIGPYRFEEVIGRGGMGVVYAATQEEPVQRRVAIKLMRSSLEGSSGRARFEAERRALASLLHPNIAQLLEAGVTTDDRPYFVMELVEGTQITKYCDERQLDIYRRLEIFIDACKAVEHAHRRQLLHRDLKPSNMLVADVEGDPVVKVIDFGIAKVLGGEADYSGSRGVLGTPEYMSPEALKGLELDTRADVYALGVVLYQLLCGGFPFGRKRSLGAAILAPEGEEMILPSTSLASSEDGPLLALQRSATLAELKRSMAADLDWVVSHSLARDRDDRYGSARELADDLRRFLEHRPVLARPPVWNYRFRKLVARHRPASVAVGFAMVAVLVAALFGVRYTVDVQRALKSTEEARRDAEVLVTFVLDDLYRELASVARRDLLEDVATRATDYFETLPHSLRAEAAVRHAQALRNLGRVQLEQGNITGARMALEQALELDQSALARSGGAEAQAGLASDYLGMSNLYERDGDGELALSAVERAVELRRDLVRTGTGGDQRDLLALDLIELGWALRDLQDLEGAVVSFDESIQILRGLEQGQPQAERRYRLGTVLKDRGATLRVRDGAQAGLRDSEESLALLEGLHQVEPNRIDFVADAGAVWIAHAVLLGELESSTDAVQAAETGVARLVSWTRIDTASARAKEYLAYGRLELAKLLQQQGNTEEARGQLRQLLDVTGGLPQELGVTVLSAEALLMLGRVKEARPLIEPLIDAGWHLSRPSLLELCRSAGFLD